jgi:hypothetical protein
MDPKKHNTWKKDNMMSAIMAVRNKEMGLLQASIVFEVPKSTLKDKVKSKEQIFELVGSLSCPRTSKMH